MPDHLAARLGCAEMKVATWDDLAFKLIILGWNVRILQKSQENGQNRTNTDTGKEFEYKSWENAIKDDIIFGSTKKEMCDEFEKLMKDKFQMSSMRELTFFLGLQVIHKADGIFISQEKYVVEILRKFNYTDVKTASIAIDLEKPLVKDGDANDVDVHLYRSMIGSLMYLTTSRPDIIYLKGKPTLGLWYSRDSLFELVAYFDSDYASATQDRKPTIGDLLTKGFDAGSTARTATATTNTDGEVEITAIIDGQSKTITEASLRRHLKLKDNDGVTSIPNSKIFEQLALMGYQTDLDKLTF
ncbi:uncharacterized mitochondrial protein-like protein [Tanacetum coccineum]|uniref:Uncharacterized mitochondrial protein-like protein n=1 Tax=Tanacetum coccineum TaxID=301880 RepID=A0ABQ5IG22_9ASTR